MATFFLHDSLPDASQNEIATAFREAFLGLQKLESSLNEDDEISVATLSKPNEQHFSNVFLPTLTYSEEKDFQTYIYSKLTRCPAEPEILGDLPDELNSEDEDADLEERLILSHNYELFGKDAMYIALAKEADWIAFSLPLHPILRTDMLELIHRDNREILHVENFFGVNIPFVITILRDRRELRITQYERFLETLSKWNIVVHDDFKKSFVDQSNVIQQGIIDLFTSARNRNMLVPCIPDGKLIKKGEVSINKKIYELRTPNFDGLRVYFDQEGDKLFLIDIDFKSNYPSKNAQTKALKKAAAKALSLKAKHSN